MLSILRRSDFGIRVFLVGFGRAGVDVCSIYYSRCVVSSFVHYLDHLAISHMFGFSWIAADTAPYPCYLREGGIYSFCAGICYFIACTLVCSTPKPVPVCRRIQATDENDPMCCIRYKEGDVVDLEVQKQNEEENDNERGGPVPPRAPIVAPTQAQGGGPGHNEPVRTSSDDPHPYQTAVVSEPVVNNRIESELENSSRGRQVRPTAKISEEATAADSWPSTTRQIIRSPVREEWPDPIPRQSADDGWASTRQFP